MAFKKNGVFFLRAIVSSAILNQNLTCELNNYAVFTDVFKFKNWIASHDSSYVIPVQTPLPPKPVDCRDGSDENDCRKMMKI